MERLFLKGLPVSNGVGLGELYVIKIEAHEINKGTVDKRRVKAEIERLKKGIDSTLNEFQNLGNNLEKKLITQSNMIFEVYETILKDSLFINEISELITEKRFYADNAVDTCFKGYVDEIDESDNDYAKQRIYDLNDLAARIIRNMSEEKEDAFLDGIYHKQIIAVRELTPSIAAALGKIKVRGIVAYEGAAFFSHSAIILRSLGIPVLNDINYDFIKRFESQQVAIDGTDGFLIINPDKTDTDRYRNILKSNLRLQKELLSQKHKQSTTKDGHRIKLLANIGNVKDCDEALEMNSEGIGLVRTELLFAADGKMPDEYEQSMIYGKIAKKMGNRPVIIRTADIGEEKVLGYAGIEKEDTKKKSRGIKNSLQNREEFIAQIRAILRSVEFGNIGITFPMVNNPDEIREIKEIIKTSETQLSHQMHKPVRISKIGAFIETKQGMSNLEILLPELDFINLGTNDLLQHVFGKDRKHSRVKNVEYFNPQFLKLIQTCINVAKSYNKPVSICGEMASDPAASILLIGMGVIELSMSPSKIPAVKKTIAKITMDEARQLAAAAIGALSINEVKRILSKKLGKS